MATTYPNYLPFNTETNYSDVEITIKQMYADLNSQKGCCNNSKTDKTLCQVDGLFQAMQIDFDAEDIVRYQNDVRTSYILLSSYFNLV